MMSGLKRQRRLTGGQGSEVSVLLKEFPAKVNEKAEDRSYSN
jgi:hypothetical protein